VGSWRTIVSAQGSNNPRLLFNLQPKNWFDSGLYDLVSDLTKRFSHFMSTFGFFPQISLAGNNSHGVQDGKFVLGVNEPNFLHFHIICRQVVAFDCGSGVPLVCPEPGDLFNMREGKSKYAGEERKAMMDFLKGGFLAFLNK